MKRTCAVAMFLLIAASACANATDCPSAIEQDASFPGGPEGDDIDDAVVEHDDSHEPKRAWLH